VACSCWSAIRLLDSHFHLLCRIRLARPKVRRLLKLDRLQILTMKFPCHRIPISEYKESREIFLAVYNIGFVSIIAIPLAHVLWYEPTASIAVISAGTCFATTVSVVCLFVTKFLAIAQGRESRTSQGGSTGSFTKPTSRANHKSSSNTSTKVHPSRGDGREGDSAISSESESSEGL
jgi:hypothetical protein